MQLSLELVADLGSQLGPAEADDQAADLGEHRDQANGQWRQGGRKMRCREESEASSMIHRGALSGRVTGSVPSVTSQERRLSFNSPELIQGGVETTPRVKTARISWKSLALARSHPWKLVRPLIPKPKPGGRPQSVNRREILNAVFYLVRGGIQWRMLPTTFPHGERSITTIGNGVAMARGRRSRTPCGPRSGTRPADTKPQHRHHRQPNREQTEMGGPRGYDAGKRIKGRKRHILVDTSGLLLALVVHSAGIQDPAGAKLVLAKIVGRFPRLRLIWTDGAYQPVVGWAKSSAAGLWSWSASRRSCGPSRCCPTGGKSSGRSGG